MLCDVCELNKIDIIDDEYIVNVLSDVLSRYSNETLEIEDNGFGYDISLVFEDMPYSFTSLMFYTDNGELNVVQYGIGGEHEESIHIGTFSRDMSQDDYDRLKDKILKILRAYYKYAPQYYQLAKKFDIFYGFVIVTKYNTDDRITLHFCATNPEYMLATNDGLFISDKIDLNY